MQACAYSLHKLVRPFNPWTSSERTNSDFTQILNWKRTRPRRLAVLVLSIITCWYCVLTHDISVRRRLGITTHLPFLLRSRKILSMHGSEKFHRFLYSKRCGICTQRLTTSFPKERSIDTSSPSMAGSVGCCLRVSLGQGGAFSGKDEGTSKYLLVTYHPQSG